MKKPSNRKIKQTLLAVPAAALMLGAAHAQSTVGLNFQQWYYDSGNNPQTIGFNNGYSDYNTTGLPVTTNAFGVSLANWTSADPLGSEYNANSINQACTFGGTATTFAGGLSCYVNSPLGAHSSGAGELQALGGPYPAYAPGVWVTPGNNEVLWGNLIADDPDPFSVSISGLAAKFPNGYAIQSVAALGHTQTLLPNVDFTDGSTTYTASYHIWVIQNNPNAQWPTSTAGISDASGQFTADTIYINSRADGTGVKSSLAGLIISDQPVITRNVTNNILLPTSTVLVLQPPSVVGIGLTYQWQHAGTNLPGATFSSYTNSSVGTADSGAYQIVVSSTYFPSISVSAQVANVTVVPAHPARTATFDANVATTGAQDGSGIWNNTATNWWSGSYDDYWGSPDTAVFGAGGTSNYVVTLTDNVTANAIVFNSGSYTITNSSGQALTLSSTNSPTITANATGIITAPVTISSNTLVKAGSSSLTLAGALTGTNVFVSAGTLQVLAKAGGDATYTITNGATLKIGYSTGGGYANTGISLYGDGTAATTGLYLAGGTTYNVAGIPTLLGAPTTIRQYGTGFASMGIFDINKNGLYCTAAASGSIISSNIQLVNEGYGMAVEVDPGTNTATGDLILNGPLNVDAHNGVFGLYKRGSGSLRLNSPATSTNCQLDILGGTVICGATNCIGTNAAVLIAAGATLDLNGISQSVSNVPTMAGTFKTYINKGGSPSSVVLTTTDGGTLNFGGTLVVSNTGGALALGDTFTLFNAGSYSGAFTTLQLPPVASGLAWQDNTAVNGTITVIHGSVPPSIVVDLSTTPSFAYVGGGTTYTVTASGDPVLHYLWYKNGTTHVGPDSPTFTISSAGTGDSGNYSVTVTNSYGSASSQVNQLTVVAPSLVAATAVQDSPSSFWPLNESNAPTAYNYDSQNNGTQNGGITPGVAGPNPSVYLGFNNGSTVYQFDGSTGYIDCGTGSSISGTTDFTLESWINTTNTASGAIIEQRTSGGSGYIGEYQFVINASGTLGFTIYGSGGYQFSLTSSSSSRHVNDGKWHHVAAVRSGANGYIYIDGSLVGSGSGPVQALVPTLPTYIGADLRDSSTFFQGYMANVGIYTSALSSYRISQHALKGVLGTNSLKLNIVAGGYIEDSKPVGTPHDGVNNGATWLASYTDGSSVTRSNVESFPNGAQIVIPPNADFNTTNGTICFWMETPYPTTGNGEMLVDRRIGGGGTTGLVMVLDGAPSGGLDIQYNGNTTLNTGGDVVDGNWHHVALTYDQSATGTMSVYIDGSLIASQANSAAWSWVATQEIEIARSHDTYWQQYAGLMGDFRIYSRILTASEVASVYSTAALVDTSTLKLRYNFGTAAGVGEGLSWPIGLLQSSPVVGPSAVWTTTNTTVNTYPFIPRSGVTNSSLFYRLKL